MPRVVAEGVFDAWSWCESDVVEWRRPADETTFDTAVNVDGSNPSGLVFVMHAECTFLPRELAKLHATGYGLSDEWALAPYGIDDATDLFFEHRTRPRDVLWLAASNLNALVWGLHDWVHFHNHGPFDDPPATELQCDLIALAWLRQNRRSIGGEHGLSDETLERVARGLARLSRRRFTDEGREPPFEDLESLFLGDYPGVR